MSDTTDGRVSDLVHDLRAALGESAVLTDPADMAAYVTDWTGSFTGTALAVVRPASTEQVATAVRLCAAAGVGVVPQGGNTGLVGGGVPDSGSDQVVLSLGRMRRVREVDAVADTLTVEAGAPSRPCRRPPAKPDGCSRSPSARRARAHRRHVATNAGGTAVLRYGMMRELVLGLEVVLPDGRVWDGLRPLRKDNTGYDLKQLFIGSEGTLGVVTAAVLRLLPATPRRATAFVALESRRRPPAPPPAPRARRRAADHLGAARAPGARPGPRPPAGRARPVRGPARVVRPRRARRHLRATWTSTSSRHSRPPPTGLLVDAVVAGSPAQRESLWALREGVSEAQKSAGATLKHDVTLPITALSRFVAEVGPHC